MASINVRKETGKLYLDFRFRNIRCREQTELKDTPANRKRAQNLMDKVQAEIMLGQFDYRATFPNSSNLKKIEACQMPLPQQLGRYRPWLILRHYGLTKTKCNGERAIPLQ